MVSDLEHGQEMTWDEARNLIGLGCDEDLELLVRYEVLTPPTWSDNGERFSVESMRRAVYRLGAEPLEDLLQRIRRAEKAIRASDAKRPPSLGGLLSRSCARACLGLSDRDLTYLTREGHLTLFADESDRDAFHVAEVNPLALELRATGATVKTFWLRAP